MPLDLTRVLDALTPDVWRQYENEFTPEISAIVQSGILETLARFNVGDEGLLVNLPFWKDIEGDDEVWTSGHETEPGKITAEKEVAAIFTRIKSFGAEDLVRIFSGSDALGTIIMKFTKYWDRRRQALLLAIMKGIFAAALEQHVADHPTETAGHPLFVRALNLMGDASENIRAWVMHSSVRSDLAIKKLLDPKPTEPGSATAPEFDSYLGRRVIVDDSAPVSGNVFTTYAFGAGSIAYAEGTPPDAVEIVREGKKSQTLIINRKRFIMHPRGFKWVGQSTANTPSNDEMATAANWERVFELKNIPLIAVNHTIG